MMSGAKRPEDTSSALSQLEKGDEPLWKRHTFALEQLVLRDGELMAYVDQRVEGDPGPRIDAIAWVGENIFRVVTEGTMVWIAKVAASTVTSVFEIDVRLGYFRDDMGFGQQTVQLTLRLPEGLQRDETDTGIWQVDLRTSLSERRAVECVAPFIGGPSTTGDD